MKFAIIIYTDATLVDSLPEGQFDAKMRDCLAFADELRQDGRLLDSQMLQGAATAKSLRVRNGRQTDMDEAVRIATHFPWAQTGCVEVRAVQDIEAVRRRVNRSAQQASVTP